MTDMPAQAHGTLSAQSERTKKRNAAEKRFRAYGMVAIAIGLLFLAALLIAIVRNGIPAFTQTYMTVQVELPADKLDPK